MADHDASGRPQQHDKKREQEGVEAAHTDRPEHYPQRKAERGGDDEAHACGSLCHHAGECFRNFPHEPANLARGVLGLAGGAHEPRADDHPVGAGDRRRDRLVGS